MTRARRETTKRLGLGGRLQKDKGGGGVTTKRQGGGGRDDYQKTRARG